MLTDLSKYRARFRIRTILFILASCVLLLPLGAMAFLRFQECALMIRQAERELIAQGTILVADYKQRIARAAPDPANFGVALPPCPAAAPCRAQVMPTPNLIRSYLFAPRPAAVDVPQAADPYAFGVGQDMNSLAEEAYAAMSTNMLILDYQGIIIAGLSGRGDSLLHVREIQLALNGNYAAVLRRGEDKSASLFLPSRDRRVHAAFPVTQQGRIWGVVYLSKTPQDVIAQLASMRNAVIVTGLIVGALILFLFIFVWRIIVSPIHRLLDKVNHLEDGDVPANLLSRPGTKEVAQLARKFSTMAHALHARTEYIRDFAQHMSDELNQPLNGIRLAVTKLQDCDAQLPPECRQSLQSITRDADRLSRLLIQLLELARADNISPSGEVCYIMPILKRLSDQFSSDTLAVKIEGEGHYDALISGESFESIMVKLLENAKQHDAREVRISFSLGEQELTLRVSNDGTPIPVANRDQIFTPFFSTRHEQGGSGLGLGIARSLMEAYGGRIILAPDSNGRTTFVLTIPVLH